MDANISNPITALAELSAQQFDVLKRTTDYYRVERILRSSSRINLLLGGITLWMGLSVPSYYRTIFTDVQAVMGVVIVVQSFWALFRPSVKGLLGLAIVVLISGVWNLFITAYKGIDSLNIWLGLFGLYQVWGAYQTARMYERYYGRALEKPDPENAQHYEALRQSIINPSPTVAPELLKVQFARNRYWWNGVLAQDYAVLAHPRSNEMIVADQSAVTFVAETPKWVSRDSFSILAQVNEDFLVGKIYHSGFEQYLKWKGISDPELNIPDNLKRKRVSRKISRWIMIVIIVGSLLLLVVPILLATQYY
ncbi:MAG: hypothetical protein LCI00_26315 [Chloroflexi bacterium]|nr:hypothetical protein [Chloroflexota bacterium]MCC6892864.1 hypothetical protein [Anaerolineae bacterium]